MKVYKTKDAILRHAPHLDAEDEKLLNSECFTPYIFFKDDRKNKRRECYCTACGAEFEQEFVKRIMTPDDRSLLEAEHNEIVKCPKCGRRVMLKNEGRVRDCKSLEEWRRFVAVKPVGRNTVYLICGWANKDYTGRYIKTKPIYDISAIYYLTPGYVRVFKNANPNWYAKQWYEPKSIIEPFTKSFSYNNAYAENRGYRWIGFDRLKKTFLKYAPIENFSVAYEKYFYNKPYVCVGEVPEVKFFAYSAIYPNVEKLLKLDLGEFVCSLVDGKPMKRFINWNAPTVQSMFNMTRGEFKRFREQFYNLDHFKVYEILKSANPNIPYAVAVDLCKAYSGEAAEKIAWTVKKQKLSLTKTLNYLIKAERKNFKSQYEKSTSFSRSTTAIWWKDYIYFAEKLKYDLTRSDVIYPKNLKQAHDNASGAFVIKKNQDAYAKYQKRYAALEKRYAFSNGEYQIVIPKGVNDIIEEGKILSHCVGGYAERHMKGKTTILFMRKCNAPAERLVTIEVKGNRICQNYGFHDRKVSPAEQKFINTWIQWVRAGSHRTKDKKAAGAA